jgi:hypothetical protein
MKFLTLLIFLSPVLLFSGRGDNYRPDLKRDGRNTLYGPLLRPLAGLLGDRGLGGYAELATLVGKRTVVLGEKQSVFGYDDDTVYLN